MFLIPLDWNTTVNYFLNDRKYILIFRNVTDFHVLWATIQKWLSILNKEYVCHLNLRQLWAAWIPENSEIVWSIKSFPVRHFSPASNTMSLNYTLVLDIFDIRQWDLELSWIHLLEDNMLWVYFCFCYWSQLLLCLFCSTMSRWISGW